MVLIMLAHSLSPCLAEIYWEALMCQTHCQFFVLNFY